VNWVRFRALFIPCHAASSCVASCPVQRIAIAERAKIPAVVLPFTVGGSDKAKDLYALFDDTIERLLAAAK
jgi:hypothetical protein